MRGDESVPQGTPAKVLAATAAASACLLVFRAQSLALALRTAPRSASATCLQVYRGVSGDSSGTEPEALLLSALVMIAHALHCLPSRFEAPPDESTVTDLVSSVQDFRDRGGEDNRFAAACLGLTCDEIMSEVELSCERGVSPCAEMQALGPNPAKGGDESWAAVREACTSRYEYQEVAWSDLATGYELNPVRQDVGSRRGGRKDTRRRAAASSRWLAASLGAASCTGITLSFKQVFTKSFTSIGAATTIAFLLVALFSGTGGEGSPAAGLLTVHACTPGTNGWHPESAIPVWAAFLTALVCSGFLLALALPTTFRCVASFARLRRSSGSSPL